MSLETDHNKSGLTLFRKVTVDKGFDTLKIYEMRKSVSK
jgi:hypothetical protein